MNKGFSIIEFMIAMTLGALLVATAGSVYLSNKSTWQMQAGLARLQENARHANYFLNYEIRAAGYQGCITGGSATINNLVKNPSSAVNFDNPVRGYDGEGAFSPSLPANLTGKAALGSDVVEVRRASNTSVQLSSDMVNPKTAVHVYERLGIQAEEVLIVSDCAVGDIFKAGANTNATVIAVSSSNNNTPALTKAFTTSSQVMRFIYYSFYIKDTGRTNAANQPVYALVRQDLNGTEVEIAEGVEKMRIQYGVDTNADRTADLFQTATEVNSSNNWNKVIGLKINLLLSTIENVANQPQAYQFNGGTITPADNQLRREWETYVTVRNRGLPL